jgi:nucleotide-binding universal stress UspA family protein
MGKRKRDAEGFGGRPGRFLCGTVFALKLQRWGVGTVTFQNQSGPGRKQMKIMVCFDGSKESEEAVRCAAACAKGIGAEVIVVTSMVGGVEVPRREFLTRERELGYAQSLLTEAGILAQTRLSVRGMEPGEDLVKIAEESGVDQVFLGVRKRSKVGKLLFGSTAQFVILNAPCPVVCVK